MKIEKLDESKNTNVMYTYKISDGFIQANVNVFAYYGDDVNGFMDPGEITDVEIEYYLNGRPCNLSGFAELYIKCYGEKAFTMYEHEIQDLAIKTASLEGYTTKINTNTKNTRSK